jgi:cytochrome oxidase Cu insertion factor (SCO1/SenC/PrrC family)
MAAMRLPLRLLAIVLSVLIIVGLAWLWQARGAQGTATPEQTANKALVGGPFALIDGAGKPVTEALLKDRLSLVYFGFTYCPDICPTELQVVAQAVDAFETAHPDKRGLVLPLFITVDPERDTPKAITTYVQAFHPRMIGLTGSLAQIEAAKTAYRVYAAKVEEPETNSYTMDHSSIIFLMDRRGDYAAHFGAGTDPATIAAKLAELAG